MKTCRSPAQDKRRAEQELRELGRSMTLWFTPHGNPRKAMDIAVTFVPLENRIKRAVHLVLLVEIWIKGCVYPSEQ